jgi:DNA polymerase-3 subunit gamma/tau
MSQALYRKYRPKTFAEIIGQDVIKTIIQNAVASDQVSHAYLFTGPRGVGKTTVARLLAKAVNCLSPKNGEPDATCENCLAVQQGRFLDLLEIDAASYTGVDNIREIIDHVKFTPSKGQYKVFIIDEVHMLSKAAFNALLKTLEEPPLHAIFILATTEVHKVPATIISRSQRFDFKRVSQAEILKLLERVLPDLDLKISPEAQKLLAAAADGSFRDGLSLLDQLSSFGSKKITLEEVEEILGITRIEANQKFLDFLIENQTDKAINFVKTLALEGKDLVQFTRNFLEYLRMALYVKMAIEKIEDLGLAAEEEKKLLSHSQALSGARLLQIIKILLEAHREIKTSPVPELPLLAAVLTLAESLAGATSDPKPPASELNLGKVIDQWAEVLSRVKEYNHSLLSSLRLARVAEFSGSDLTLVFPYNFHKETIAARKNRLVVEQVLEEVFGRKIKIKVELEEGQDLMGEALRVLGNNQEK